MAKIYSPHEVVAGRAEVIEILGSGGQATVYKVRDSVTSRVACLKQLNADPSTTNGRIALQRLQREFKIPFDSPHVPKSLAMFEHEGHHFILTELVEGVTLEQKLVAEKRPFSSSVTADILYQVAETLVVAHNCGIVHRDLKIANIMQSRSGTIYVIDWGLYRILGSATICCGDGPIGSIYFMSPEHVLSCEVDAQSDLFSLGTVAYFCLTWLYPFDGKTETEIFEGILKGNPPPPIALNPDTDPALNGIILRLLEKDKAKRYPTAAALLTDLKDGFGACDGHSRCKCGEPIAEGTAYCVRCGSRLKGDVSPERGCLRVLNGSMAGHEIEISRAGIVLGRSSLGVEDHFISRRHIEVVFEGGRFVIQDLGSMNGTELNGVSLPAHTPRPLSAGDCVRLADTVCEFRV